jgi:NAD(P)-dependent dehydrogenase (short-subunit alcohol dehydrogenase family)
MASHTPRDLSGLSVVVTGGARGIGRATAARLAAAGARVTLGDVDADLAAAAAAEIGHGVVARRLDVTDRTSWEGLAAAVGPVDVLVNNAGIMPVGPVLEEPDAVTRAIVGVNLMGVVLGTKVLAPAMVERGGGQIVNVASAVGRVPAAGGASYTASKFAVVGFSEATRAELEPLGVEVCLVMPTVVRTDLASGVPQARFVRQVLPEEVAGAIEATIRRPRPEVWVPRWTQGVTRATQLLPRPVQQAIARLFRADVLAAVDPAARAAYEARVRRPADVPADAPQD